jgi:hypothetical protein
MVKAARSLDFAVDRRVERLSLWGYPVDDGSL